MNAHSEFRTLLLDSFDAVVKAAIPDFTLPAHLPPPPKGKTYIVGAGKAAARMAQVFEQHYKAPFEGMVITRYGHGVPTKIIEVVEASHPVPDDAGRKAAARMLDFVSNAGADDLVICLLSGGGSSLLSLPHEGIDFEELRAINKQLLASGAPIQHINTVRKHLNRAFGGKLAQAAYPAKIITLSISDVAGDDPSTIASGPTVGDPTTLGDTLRILKHYEIQTGPSVLAHLQNPAHETPKPDNPIFKNSEYILIATPQSTLEKGAEHLRAKGFTPYILSTDMEGDTNECALFHTSIVQQVLTRGQPFARGCAIISGGETTVQIKGKGDGGPNTQFMLRAAMALDGQAHVYALACDTDGIDGSMDNAGAIIDPGTLSRAQAKSLSAQAYLDNNDSYRFFEGLGDLVIPGPTYTNVNDYRVFLVTKQ